IPSVRRASGMASEVVVGEIDSATDWSAALAGCDAIVHLAARTHVMRETAADPLALYRATNTEATLNLARQAALAGVKRLVFLSSIKVNGEGRETPYRETDVPAPEDAYARSKWEAEQGLRALARETGMEVVIIRAPLVYGPGVKGNFAKLVRWVRKGVPLPLGAVHNRRSLLALDNLVDFIALCADRERAPQAANEVFLLSDGEDVSTSELLRKVARAYGVKPRLLPVHASLMWGLANALGMRALACRLLGSLVVDSSKARALLGWRPAVSMDEQLRKMALHDTGL
ncbi:MAG: NAD-dependent epimerase/dehydratase family protein, partial [Thiobacillaceae bacterium]